MQYENKVKMKYNSLFLFFFMNHSLSTYSLWKCMEISLQNLYVDIRAKTIDKK